MRRKEHEATPVAMFILSQPIAILMASPNAGPTCRKDYSNDIGTSDCATGWLEANA